MYTGARPLGPVTHAHRGDGCGSGGQRACRTSVLPDVVNDLAIVRKLPRGVGMPPRRAAWSPRACSRSRHRKGRVPAGLGLDSSVIAIGASGIVDDQSRPPDLRMTATIGGDLRGVDEHALDLGRLIGASHPALDAHIGSAAWETPSARKLDRRQVAGAEANQRIVRDCAASVTTTSPTSPVATGSPVPGRTISTSTPSSTMRPSAPRDS